MDGLFDTAVKQAAAHGKARIFAVVYGIARCRIDALDAEFVCFAVVHAQHPFVLAGAKSARATFQTDNGGFVYLCRAVIAL